MANQNWLIRVGDRKHSFWQLVCVQGSGFNFVKISELQLLLCESLKRRLIIRGNCLISDRLLRVYYLEKHFDLTPVFKNVLEPYIEVKALCVSGPFSCTRYTLYIWAQGFVFSSPEPEAYGIGIL